MAEIVRRRSWGGVLPLGRHCSTSGSSRPHCVSVSIAPPHLGRSPGKVTWEGAKCYLSEEVQGRTGPRQHAVAIGLKHSGRHLVFEGIVARGSRHHGGHSSD